MGKKVYGLIGFPLGHSASKKFFNEKWKREGITDAIFELYPIENVESIEEIISAEKNLKGLAVTIPHKQTVMPLLTKLSDEAVKIGAVNCIKIVDNKTFGYNTDVYGFEHSFMPLLKPIHKKALVLGTGGASKAVIYVLQKHKIPYLLVSRTANQEENKIAYEQIDSKILEEYNIVINCSPVGMTPNENQAPAIPYELLGPDNYLYDLVYKPAETKFLQLGEEKGVLAKNGFEMLLLQAEENWKIWND